MLTAANKIVAFTVQGRPVPKQSFRYSRRGCYISPRVKQWQRTVGWEARIAYQGEPLACDLDVRLTFRLPTRRRTDSDNLSKGVLDACNGILWEDDKQVVKLEITKAIDKQNPGVDVEVCKYDRDSE